jgi:hypothetical protein
MFLDTVYQVINETKNESQTPDVNRSISYTSNAVSYLKSICQPQKVPIVLGISPD